MELLVLGLVLSPHGLNLMIRLFVFQTFIPQELYWDSVTRTWKLDTTPNLVRAFLFFL